MGSLKLCGTTIFSLIFFVFLSISTTTQGCSTTFCRRTEPVIRFPFRITDRQPESCGYDPGFDLSCNAANTTVLSLPYSGNFSVQAINYARQELWLNDPDNCLPKKLLSLNFSGSPFTGVYNRVFTFFDCPNEYLKYRLNPISCLSSGNRSVIATSSGSVIDFLSSRCVLMKVVTIPSQYPFYEEVWSSDLSDDLWLTWSAPSCRRCESRGGRCAFKNNSTRETGCFKYSRPGVPKAARYAIIIGVGIPGFLCVVGVICFLCSRMKGAVYRRNEIVIEFRTTTVVAPPQSSNVVGGIDGPTLQSYPKVLLGESRRLPNPDDDTCSICMSEYKPKETIKSLPQCNHGFHAECIDQWLGSNATCPICRNSPPKKVSAVHPS